MTNDPPAIATDLPDLPAADLLEALARLHQLVLLLDENGRIVWVSGELGAWSGRRECLVGRSARDLFGRAPRRDLRERLERDGSLANERIQVINGDGVGIPVELSAVPVPVPAAGGGGEGRPGLLAIVRPVDRGVELRDELRHTAPYFRAILDSSPEAVLAVDRRGYVTYANAAFESLLGEPAERLFDKPVTLVFSRRSALGAIATALEPDSDGGSVELELAVPGGQRIVDVSTSPLCLADGSEVGTVAFLRDVTQERHFEGALARKNQELEHYVHAVSHDLRTPLVSLLGFSRLLSQDYGDVLSDTGRHFLERIEQASRTMEGLINDLLELSRIGRAGTRPELTDTLSIVRQLAHELKPRLDGAGIALRLPASPPPVMCVRTQLYQVFSNLIGNAIEHMGHVQDPWIEVGVDETPGHHAIWVRDNGQGLTPEECDRVFEIFHTVRRRPGEKRGTGIGLAIVKKIAETHGGRAWVESESGCGATFVLELPRG